MVKTLNPSDFWATPKEAVTPLLQHLPMRFGFYEPCAGARDLVHHLEVANSKCHCLSASDIAPRHEFVIELDALTFAFNLMSESQEYHYSDDNYEFIITNPPFSRENMALCKQMIHDFMHARKTWLLLPFGMAANIGMRNLMKKCAQFVTIGRVKWIPGSRNKETRDMAWFLFDKNHTGPSKFHPYWEASA